MRKLKSFDNEVELTKEESYIIEKKFLDDFKISDNVVEKEICVDKILKRKKYKFVEKDYNRPQAIFFVELDSNITIFGRKLLSELYINKLIPSKNCSLISKNMIIGILYNYNKSGRNVEIEYYPLTDGERKYIFNKFLKVNNKINIYYPFKFYDYNTNKEVDSPKEGWKIYDNTAQILFNGEKHLRQYTINFLKQLEINKGQIFFDPACSTGDFLYSIKKEFPDIVTIGQDLGKDMVECSKNKLDKVYFGNSIDTPVKDESVDFIFFRFLNSRVVTSENAKKLYDVLIKKVKKGGYIICFGHTPVLLELKEIKKEDFEIVSCNGYDNEYDSIFQYYILRRIV